ncbi:MAG: winged helix-turn-helix domain-containing protein [Acidobacteriota bacterium]|nr:winged helix-turn-helix domain-containing protein [Acidobacteriota bacterium]
MERESLEVLEFGPYKIDREQRLLTKGKCITPLAPKVFDLLLALAESGGRVLEKKSLLEKLWPDTFVEEGSLTRNISTLRKILGESPDDQKYISTVPKRGYRFVAQVYTEVSSSRLSVGPAESAAPSVCEKLLTSQISSNSQVLRPSAIVWWGGGETPPSFRNRSIAVTPVENISGDDSQDHFSEILTEALISELARIPKLKVISGSGIAAHTDSEKDFNEFVGERRLDLLAGGSVMRIGEKLRIIVAISDPQTQSEIWSQKYDRELGKIPAVQEQVACAIAAEVRADLTPQEHMKSRAAALVKPEAYDCYLRGRFYAQRQNKADNGTAILALERAITIDPTFAMAYAELAQTYTWKLFLFAPHEGRWEEKAFMAVEKALALDPDLASAYLARGRFLWTPANHFPHTRAVREYRRALALDRNLDEARNQLALIYCHIGFFDEALRESQEAALTNPNNHLAVYRTAQTLAFQGKFEAALAVLRTIPRGVNPSLTGYQTAWVLFNLGNSKEASATIDQLFVDYPEDDGGLFVSMQAILAASAGETHRAKTRIDLAARTGKGFGHFHHAAYHIAIAFALMNEVDEAVKWLDTAAMDGFPCYPLFENDANLDNLRQDAGFMKFMVKLRRQWTDYQSLF